MPIGDVCLRNLVTTTPDKTIEEAARLMRTHHVGDLLVVDRALGRRLLHGILTDRDIVTTVVAQGVNPNTITVGDVMTAGVQTAKEEDGISDTIRQMRAAGIRRMPVVSRDGVTVGVVTIDDLIELLADELSELAKLIATQPRKEARART